MTKKIILIFIAILMIKTLHASEKEEGSNCPNDKVLATQIDTTVNTLEPLEGSTDVMMTFTHSASYTETKGTNVINRPELIQPIIIKIHTEEWHTVEGIFRVNHINNYREWVKTSLPYKKINHSPILVLESDNPKNIKKLSEQHACSLSTNTTTKTTITTCSIRTFGHAVQVETSSNPDIGNIVLNKLDVLCIPKEKMYPPRDLRTNKNKK